MDAQDTPWTTPQLLVAVTLAALPFALDLADARFALGLSKEAMFAVFGWAVAILVIASSRPRHRAA